MELIDKQATIDWLKKVTVTEGITFEAGFEQIIYDIEQMPSVTPKASEDCINRQEVLDIINFENEWLLDAKSHNEDTKIAFSGLNSRVKALPSVQPTRPTGKWIDIGNEGLVFKCSICGTKKTIESHFCPNCGSEMTELKTN